MILSAYAIYDHALKCYATPFFSQNDASATRSFAMLKNDPTTPFSQFYQDFDLYCLGQFEDDTGLLIPLSPTRLVVKGSTVFQDGNYDK